MFDVFQKHLESMVKLSTERYALIRSVAIEKHIRKNNTCFRRAGAETAISSFAVAASGNFASIRKMQNGHCILHPKTGGPHQPIKLPVNDPEVYPGIF